MIAGLLAEVGKKVIERWFTQIVLPGLAFVLLLACAWTLGWAHMVDLAVLRVNVDKLLTAQGNMRGAEVLLCVGAVAVGVMAGLLAVGLSHGVSAIWLSRRTCLGDRLRATDDAVEAVYGVSMALVWPRIWQIMPGEAKQEIQAAWNAYISATLQAAWSIFYLAVGFLWPPAVVIGAALAITSRWRAGRAVEAFAELTRATVDVTINQLANTLGLTTLHGRVTPQNEGPEINEILA